MRLDRGERKEGRAAAVAALEHLDGGLAVLLGGDDNVLHGGAERRLDGGGIAVFHADELGNRAVDAAKLSGCRILHNKADGLGKALVFALHLTEHTDLRIKRIELDAGGVQLPLQAVALVLTRFQAKLIARDGIFRALRVVLRLFKTFFAGELLRRDPLLPGLCGSPVLLQRLSAGKDLLHGGLHGGDLRSHGGALRLQKRLLGTEGNELLSGFAGLLCESLRLLLNGSKGVICSGQRAGIFFDLLPLGLDLARNAAASRLLILQLLPDAVDVRLVVLDLRAQERNFVLCLLAFGLHLADVLALLVELKRLVVVLQAELLGLAVERGQLVVRLFEDESGGGVIRLGLAGAFGDFFEIFQPDRDLKTLELGAEGQIFLRLLRLLPQRADLKLQLGDLIADAQQIVLGVG